MVMDLTLILVKSSVEKDNVKRKKTDFHQVIVQFWCFCPSMTIQEWIVMEGQNHCLKSVDDGAVYEVHEVTVF